MSSLEGSAIDDALVANFRVGEDLDFEENCRSFERTLAISSSLALI